MYLDQSEEFKSWVSVLAGECIRRGEVPVGASVVRSGWVGLYGRPLSVPVEEGLYGRPRSSFPLKDVASILCRGNKTPLSRETCTRVKVEHEQREEHGEESRRAICGWLMLTSRKRTHPQEYK